MDFQTLIKQAANIQASKQKELETKKKVNDTEKQRTKLQEIDRKRESKKRLGQYEQETIKSRLMYHGLASSSGSPLKHVATPSASTSTTTTSKATTSLNKNSQRQLQALGSLKPKETHKGVKGKSFSPLPSTMKQKNAGKVHVAKTLSNSSIVAKRKTLPPGKLKSSTMPTDFQELLKIAQRNSSSNKTSSNAPLTNNTRSPSHIIQKPSGPVSIGVGRSLLDKSSRLDRHRSMMEASSSKQQNGDSFVNQEKKLLVNEGTKKNNSVLPSGKRQIDKNKISPGQRGTQVQQPQSSDKERVNPYPRPYPRPYESGCGQQLDLEKSNSVIKSNGPSPNGIGTQIRGRGNNSHVRGRGSMRGRGAPSDRSRNPNRFYSASARLISDGPSGRVPMMGYRSTWADEMSEYLRNNEYELEEEDDGEFDDFVVDDDGYGGGEYGDDGGEDYSSAIRSIFGDRYLSGPNNHDEEVMESSFAQQQFEEMRSARIGRIEDEEDIKREKEMERKRQQKITNNTSSKKARLK